MPIHSLDEHERVAPLFPWQYFIAFNKGLAHFMAGRTDIAAAEIERAALLNPDYPYTWLAKTILASVMGHSDEAAKAVGRLRQLEGDDSLDLQVSRIAHSYPDGPMLETLQSMISNVWNRAKAG